MVLSLVGNKIDLEQQRMVSREEAFLYAASIGATYFETSVVNDQGIEQVFISTALGLIRLSSEPTCSSIHRYESMDSLTTTPGRRSQMNGIVQIGIPVDPQTPATDGTMGRLERGTWSIDHIAHGSEERVGWCCF
jgi:Ras-related protein Rab-21